MNKPLRPIWIILLLAWSLLPMLWQLLSSFTSPEALVSDQATLLNRWSLANYRDL